ncbi:MULTISPECIES: PLDc N-terminal domain-containing protein [unclassified Haladaptatus]|uniref:PLDc N-terminal domain-containing protein n=1 Tax=unclassified Haladaptatus TaxID=2622732 RepID=UPI0023E874AC|nr:MULTISPECIES: PLDc N-terminal domain-containing protein [unclassified Haladaptatus]
MVDTTVTVGLLYLVVWLGVTLWVFQDAEYRRSKGTLLWTVVVFLGGVIGLFLYFLIGRR